MRKLTMPATAFGVLTTLVALGGANPAGAAGRDSFERANDSKLSLPALEYGGDEDDDDDDDVEEGSSGSTQSSGSGASSGEGQLASTGSDVSSIVMIGGFAMAVGAVMYRVSTRRSRTSLALHDSSVS